MRSRAVNMAGFTLLPVILAMSLIAAIAFLLNRDNGINAGMVAVQGDAARARYVAEAGLQAVNAITQGKNCTGYTDLGTTAFGAGSFIATVTPTSGTPVTLTAAATTADGANAALTRANVVVYQATPTPATLQAPDSTGTEASLNWTSPTNNYGASTILKVITADYSALIHFDLSSIPAGSSITGATLKLSKTNTTASPGSIVVYRVKKPWVEGTQSGAVNTTGVTYNNSDVTTPWTTPGGDYDPAPMGSLTNIVQGWNSWDVTGLVQGWSTASYPNYGMILVPDGVVSANFDSSDSLANHPILLVTYLAPCAGPPPPPPPPPGTVVTLPASQDTWISQDTATSNFGSSTSLTVTNLALKKGRGLVKFDLSSIPAGTVLQSAKLKLYVDLFTNPQNSILTVNRGNDSFGPWTEAGATWKRRDGTNAWSGAWGGSYNTTAAASVTLLASFTPGGWVEWNVTALAQEWLDGVGTNYGAFVLIDTSSAVIFNSRESSVDQPQLVISY